MHGTSLKNFSGTMTDATSFEEKEFLALRHRLASTSLGHVTENSTPTELKENRDMDQLSPPRQLKPKEDTDSASVIATSPSTPSPTHCGYATQESTTSTSHLQVALKVLVSNGASGLVIGRCGKTISEIQERTKARIKLSQGGDYYPGTADRVCLVQGSLTNTISAVNSVLSKLYEIQRLQKFPSQNDSIIEFDATTEVDENPTSFIVRFLIPSAFCGMIIGRGGSNIKSLKEKSGVSTIQLSQKENDVMTDAAASIMASTSERIMTISGTGMKGCMQCITSILNEMALNPEVSRYVNMTTSYSKMVVAAQHSFAVTEAVRNTLRSEHVFQEQWNQLRFRDPPAIQPRDHPFTPAPQQQLNAHLPPREDIHGFDANVQGNMLVLSQSDSYEYNILPSTTCDSRVPYESHNTTYQRPFSTHSQNDTPSSRTINPPASMWSPIEVPPAPCSGNSNIFYTSVSPISQASHNTSVPMAMPVPQDGLPHNASGNTARFGVPEHLVGSILGRKGKTLTEIQAMSNTRIRISQRGEYIPGTNQRIVNITGVTSENVAAAQTLISQRLSQS
mmetsp:Transcript_2761/g.5391  ORF Transcript_2761/g.5391 Transcript_2761/m.5391 type:complete len:563 (+) Transcript_2761:473-2161(+)